MFLISSIFSSLTGNAYDEDVITESVKIRKNTKLQADDDINNSKVANDAKYGTQSENEFKQELEDKQKKDGTIGALDPQQEESVKPKLPNVNLLAENIEYEVNDKVIYDGEVWDVFSIVSTENNLQNLKITRNGHTIDVLSNKVKPEPSMFDDIELDDSIDKFDLDKNKLNKKPENEKPEKMANLNDNKVNCNLIINNAIIKETFNGERFNAKLSDIYEGLDDITVYMGNGEEEQFNKDQISIEQEDWPYAVIADDNDEPLRKIRVNPMSYINAEDENDLVDCIVGDKFTQIPKRIIRVMS